jgi:hypothetical protein
MRTVSIAGAALTALSFFFIAPAAHAKPVQLGAGLIGLAGGNFQSKPDRGPADPDVNPGFGGLTIGGGLLLDARFIDLIGLEVDVIRSSDHGKGTVTFNGVDTKVTIGQGAWHIPILAKLTFPSPIVAPTIFLGPEIVAPSSGKTSVEVALPGVTLPPPPEKADTYVELTFGAGVEIKLPLPVIDLRIPIQLRGSYTPSVSSKFADRTPIINGVLGYRSEWQFAAVATLGAAIYF